MNSRERVRLAINHQEPDRVPLDLSAAPTTGMQVQSGVFTPAGAKTRSAWHPGQSDRALPDAGRN